MTVMDDGYRQRKKKPCDAFKMVTEHYIIYIRISDLIINLDLHEHDACS